MSLNNITLSISWSSTRNAAHWNYEVSNMLVEHKGNPSSWKLLNCNTWTTNLDWIHISSLYIKSIKIRPLTCKRSADQMTYLILDDYPKHVDENLKELKSENSWKEKEIPSLILEAAFPGAWIIPTVPWAFPIVCLMKYTILLDSCFDFLAF